MSVNAAGAHVYFIQYRAENSASRLFKLLFDLSCKPPADAVILNHQHGAVAFSRHYRCINDTPKRRRIHDYVIKLPAQAKKCLLEFFPTQKLTRIGRHGSGKNHVQILDIGHMYNRFQCFLACQHMDQPMVHRPGFISSHQYGFAQIGIHQNHLLSRLRKRPCQFHRHGSFAFIRRAACYDNRPNIRTAQLYVCAKCLISFSRSVIVLRLKAERNFPRHVKRFRIRLPGNAAIYTPTVFHVSEPFFLFCRKYFSSFSCGFCPYPDSPAAELAPTWKVPDIFRYPRRI